MTFTETAIRVVEQHGVTLQPWASGSHLLAVVGLGAGIAMATADAIVREYFDTELLVADLSGAIGRESRIAILDYVGTAMPAVFLMSSSLASGEVYPRALKERDFRPLSLYVHCAGIESKKSSELWAELGATVIKSLWGKDPLSGYLQRRKTLQDAPFMASMSSYD